ncbi:MAG: hypothetical protein M1829_004179 [Trizodia sp. TS-e1964]|nr:MAG: hypothetical protein M1829_004179 [Trizodia sp. TS-e1964]
MIRFPRRPSELDPLLPQNAPAPEILQQLNGEALEDHQSADPDNLFIDSPSARKISRRNLFFAIFTTLAAFAIFVSIFVPGGLGAIWRGKDRPLSLEQRVDRILSSTPLIDGHNDLAILIRIAYNNHIQQHNFTEPFENGRFPFHVDLPRLKKGRVGGTFWSAFVMCPANGTDFSNENYAASVRMTLEQVDLLRQLQQAYPSVFSPPPASSSAAFDAFQIGQIASPYGIEGLHQIGNSFSTLRLLYSLGVRYATLTHSCHNRYADAALLGRPMRAAEPYWGGLSKDGKVAIREMNRMGMIVDLSHASHSTMRDVLGGSPPTTSAPVIFSHSSAYGICPHPRNVPDDVLLLVKKTNSIVMVNFLSDFISCTGLNITSGLPNFYPKNSTLAQVVRHITYIGDMIGYDHVGLGSDFDGEPSLPEGLGDVSKFPDLVAEMLNQGISDQDAEKVIGLNILRVWRDVEKAADLARASGVLPAEDDLPGLRF